MIVINLKKLIYIVKVVCIKIDWDWGINFINNEWCKYMIESWYIFVSKIKEVIDIILLLYLVSWLFKKL